MKFYFDDVDFDSQYVRTLGKTIFGCAKVGECIAAASAITQETTNLGTPNGPRWRGDWSLMRSSL